MSKLIDIDYLRDVCNIIDNGYIDLSPVWADIKAQGLAQHEIKVKAGTHRAKKQFAKDAWEIGIAGEVAFSIFAGEPIDIGVYKYGKDFDDFFGGNVEVKTTRYLPPLIKEFPHKFKKLVEQNSQTKYVLAHCDVKQKAVKLFGWCTAQQVLDGTLRDFGYGMRLVVGPEELNPMETLDW